MSEKNLFWHLNNITNEKEQFIESDEASSKTYNNFMINRYVSTSEMYLGAIEEINRYNLPKHVHNRFMCSVLPKRKLYFDYSKLKSDKDEKKKYLEVLSKYMEVSFKDAEHFSEFLDIKDLKSIAEKYK